MPATNSTTYFWYHHDCATMSDNTMSTTPLQINEPKKMLETKFVEQGTTNTALTAKC